MAHRARKGGYFSLFCSTDRSLLPHVCFGILEDGSKPAKLYCGAVGTSALSPLSTFVAVHFDECSAIRW